MTEPIRYPIRSRPAAPHGMGRHVNHDPRSRSFAYAATAGSLRPVFHRRHVPIFDQGALGSCTGNAALGILATGPYWDALPTDVQRNGLIAPWGRGDVPWTEDGAVVLYSEITRTDDFTGSYPPDDTGSDGLSAAKVLRSAGIVPGYEHTFSAVDAVRALQDFPLMVGTVWRGSMFSPDRFGRIAPLGSVMGGHEWIVDEYVPAGAESIATGVRFADTVAYVGGTTSWGTNFGVGGRFYLTADAFANLLTDDGDVIVLKPPAVAPTPRPEPPALTAQEVADRIRQELSDMGL